MRVALLTHPASSVFRGGPRVQLEQTATELKTLGVEIVHVTGENQVGPRDVDLVHIFGAGMGTYHVARALRLQSIPMVVSPIYITRRSPMQVRAVRGVDRMMRRLFPGFWTDYGMIAEMCDWSKIVAPNTDEEGALLRHAFGVPQDKLMKIPNGVEERFAHASPDLFVREYGMKDFVLNVGHIGPARKNIRRLVRALETTNIPSVIIGRIEETEEARQIVERARRHPAMLVLDHLDHASEMLASAYAAARVFVLPSLFETPGIAALEAALAGASVVITPHGGTREYFDDLAVYVDPYSVADIRRGIEEAFGKVQSDTLSWRVGERFLWKHVAARTLEVYRQALSG